MKKKQFSPSANQLDAAENLVIAMALHATVKEAVHAAETQLLLEGCFLNEKGERLTDRRYAFELAGTMSFDTPEYVGSHAERFYALLREDLLGKGFLNGENAEAVLSMEVIRLENAFIETTKPLHKLDIAEIVMLTHREQLLNLTLNLIVPFIDQKGLEDKKQNFYKKHCK